MAQADVFNNADMLTMLATHLEHRDMLMLITSSKNYLTGSGRMWIKEKQDILVRLIEYIDSMPDIDSISDSDLVWDSDLYRTATRYRTAMPMGMNRRRAVCPTCLLCEESE